ncbi:MAG: flagellar basal body P-ring formation protein FlgA [Betaproteobacteria bacterium]|nr:flagellar basal body P-ring formation protein FlgA [Betaproteobacteria bacterium]
MNKPTMVALLLTLGTFAPCAAAQLIASAAGHPAQQPPGGATTEQLQMFLEREAGKIAARVEVSVGSLNPRMQLAPCARLEPFLPQGTRLWGRATLGVRCIEGAAWQVFLPVHIRAYGPAPVAARPLNAGEALNDSDLRIEEIELTRFPAGALADASQVADKQMARPLAVGQPLLRDHLRPRSVLAQGDTVKLVYTGQGFSVSTQARALSAAVDGQPVRVVTEGGRTLSGTARQGRVVEIKF